jgi:hypothetical protein
MIHILCLEVAADLNAAELDGRVQVQRFEVLLEIIVPHLYKQTEYN